PEPEPEPEPTPTPNPNPTVADGLAYVFDINALPEIRITVTEEQWNALLQAFDQDANTDSYVHCDATFNKSGELHSFVDAGLRLRGNTSRRRPEGNGGEMHNNSNPDYHHCHFMLHLRKYIKDDLHKIGDVRKIHLKWFKDDAAYCREVYCYDLFERYGIWTSINTSYCRLWITVGSSKEAYFGVYQMLEAIDDEYVENRVAGFADDKGFLWKCCYGADLSNTNDDRFWHDDNAGTTLRPYCLKTEIQDFELAKEQLKDFILKLNGKGDESFKKWIPTVCDVELLLKTYAVNVVLGMWDDYWCNQNNYYIYFNSKDKYNYKFFFIPYDYDNTLGTSSIIDSGTQDPLNWGDNSRKLIKRLLNIPEYRKIYVSALNELCNSDNLFGVSGSISRIQGWHSMIRNYISNDTGKDMRIEDRPAGWGNRGDYRLLQRGSSNFFETKKRSIPAN
ncbi:MAG: CotH kinase family protein, partial [Alistipes sp.]|nr:CotH kinase family protein [Alistipes sp.]